MLEDDDDEELESESSDESSDDLSFMCCNGGTMAVGFGAFFKCSLSSSLEWEKDYKMRILLV